MMELRDVSLFNKLSPEVSEAVGARFVRSQVEEGQVVFREGEQGHSLVVILDGLFELLREGPAGDIHLADVGEGRVLGLVSLIDPGPRTATLRAMSDGEIAVLDQLTFNKLWEAEGDAAAAMHQQMAVASIGELRSAERRLAEQLREPLAIDEPVLTSLLEMAVFKASDRVG
ncbi:MAG: cyclic nucleotide-binding domain-containing protein [Myxococcota bacterium]|nr:cyclic nucleotide-binding domain-containing protein [Myxococcota bacterium]